MGADFPESVMASAMTEHFNSLKGQFVEVPEWGKDGKPAVIWFDPLTFQDWVDLDDKDPQHLAKVIIKKAKDAQGNALYTLADLPTFLYKTSPAVIERVANRIRYADMIDPALLGESSSPDEKTASS